MDDKLTIQNLIDLLAEKHGMNKKDADNFVREFFVLIEEALEKDKYLKVKGLGTFKLIEVDSRESINVNTGERFEIQSHTKISFTPDANLKEIVNRPFSHFETVVLNDNVTLEDTPEESVAEENAADEDGAKDTKQSQVKSAAVQNQPEATAQDGDASKKSSTEAASMKYFIGIVAIVVLLCVSAIAFLYYPDLIDDTDVVATEETEVVEGNAEESSNSADEQVLKEDSLAEEKTRITNEDALEEASGVQQGQNMTSEKTSEATAKSESVSEKKQAEPAVTSYSDADTYTIVGTQATHTVKSGETLTKISLDYYGVKGLWSYIVKHNPDVIKNPDNVPYGTTIKIPKLAKKQ
ncbi:MAG: HU family DNA-binding protein [Bacteroides sp.]|nr:HU family DNA-binding protein [Bacteroides sp.]